MIIKNLVMMGYGQMIKLQVMELMCLVTNKDILVTCWMDWDTAKEFATIQMDQFMMDNIKMIKDMDKEHIFIKMDPNMLDSGMTVSNQDKVCTLTQME